MPLFPLLSRKSHCVRPWQSVQRGGCDAFPDPPPLLSPPPIPTRGGQCSTVWQSYHDHPVLAYSEASPIVLMGAYFQESVLRIVASHACGRREAGTVGEFSFPACLSVAANGRGGCLP